MKFGKNRNESTPHARCRAGFTAGGSSSMPMSARPTARTARCAARARSASPCSRSFGGDMPPHDDTMPCGPSMLVRERLVAVALRASRLLGDGLLRVQNGCVVELGEGVDEELPVAPDLGAVLVAPASSRRTGSPRGPAPSSPRYSRSGVVSSGSRFTKMNPSHTSHLHRHEAVVGLVEVEELALLLHEGEVALEGVAPAVVLAGELPARRRSSPRPGSRSTRACCRGGGRCCGRRAPRRRCRARRRPTCAAASISLVK